MKKAAIILSIFAITVIDVLAQGQGMGVRQKQQGSKIRFDSLPPEKIAERMTERLATDLILSEEQRKKIYEINLKTAIEQKALRDAIQQQQLLYQERMKANQEARFNAVEKLLTPEQSALWKQKREAHQQMMKERKEQSEKNE